MTTYSVVYNDCPGGFSLSVDAIEWLASYGCAPAMEILDEVKEREASFQSPVFCDADMLGLNRHNSLLVMCVSELGERASASSSSIKIRELLGKQYRIRSYDGLEVVEEPATIKWITI